MTQTPDPDRPDHPDHPGSDDSSPPQPAPPPPPHGDPIVGHGDAQGGQGVPPPPPGYDQSQQYGQQPYQQPYEQPNPQQGYPPYQQGYGQGQAGAPYGIHPSTGLPYSDKSKLVVGLLQVLLPLGIGRMYAGYTGIGVAQLVVTLVTCGVGALWPFIDGIIILTSDSKDAQGRILKS